MSYIGYVPAAKPLTSADITDSVVTSAKIVDGTIAIADLSATGTPSSTTFLRGDNTWNTPAAGAFVFLGETSASNVATVDLNGYFTSSYDYYHIYIDDHYGSVNSQSLCMRFATTGSYTVQSSGYYVGILFGGQNASGTTVVEQGTVYNDTYCTVNLYVSNTSTQVGNTVVTIFNPMGSNVKTYTTIFSGVESNINTIRCGAGGGRWNNTTAITGVRFFNASGNITARKIRIYGIKNS